MATTVRVTESTRARAAAIAAETGVSIGEVVDRALDAYATSRFWQRTQAALKQRPRDPDEDGWEHTSRDGLDRG